MGQDSAVRMQQGISRNLQENVMLDTIQLPDATDPSFTFPQESENKPLKVIERNYQNNLDSDYTEKIEELDKNFDYSSNSSDYWSKPELSLLYGTPFYEMASPSQKIALNHLYWVSQYNFTAVGETETIHYNQITAGSFSKMGGDYEMLARQLEHESLQERSHIHAFYKVNYQTIKNLLGKQAFNKPLKKKAHQPPQLSNSTDHALRFIGRMMLKGKEQYYSPYLQAFEEENKLPTLTHGFFHGRGLIPQSLLKFFAVNWGSSPFLACQYYTLRFMGNMMLKNIEHSIFMQAKKLQRQEEWIPTPTAISYYHFLDEAFHTTTSLFLARELYKHVAKPNAYEKAVANLAIYLTQKNNFNGISGVVNKRCYHDDAALMFDLYKLLQSPLFNLSSQEALHWMEKCFCHEHEGFHLSAESYQRLLSDLQRFCGHLDYLWPVNREMQVMASGNSIPQAIQNNIKTFQQFTQSVA